MHVPTTGVETSLSAQPRAAAQRGRRVTDLGTRVLHGLMALCFVGAYITAESETWRQVHNTLGETMLGLLVVRLIDGLLGPRAQRWRALAGRMAAARRQLSLLWQPAPAGVDARTGKLASKPLTALLVSLLPWLTTGVLLLIVPMVVSGLALEWGWDQRLDGWLQTWFVHPFHLSWLARWTVGLGDELIEALHELVANLMLMLILGHLLLLLIQSLIKRANLAAPMLSGINPSLGPGPDLVVKQRAWLAGLLVIGCLAYWVLPWAGLPPWGELFRVW